MVSSPDLVVQIYENVGTGFTPPVHRECQCEFQYHYRWPQFYDAFLWGDGRATAVELLDERDRALEQHFHERCDGGEFEYSTRWEQFSDALLSGDRARLDAAVDILDERDRALESHIAGMRCFGVDYAIGVTCEFEYPSRWPQLYEGLLSGDDERVRAAVGLLQVRDIDLETHLSTRVCGNIDVQGLYPDLVSQIYVNVT
jgi:hypothetical protein